MNQVFDPDNLLWRIVSRGVDLVGLSIFWALLCIPVVTIGPATSALYYTVVKCFRQKEEKTFGTFFTSFKESLKQGCLATLAILPSAALLFLGYEIMKAHWASSQGAVMFVAYDIALIIPIGIVCWLFPLLGRFSMPLPSAFKAAAFLAIRNLPRTVIVVLLTIECFSEMIAHRWTILVLPTICALFASFFLEKAFSEKQEEEA